eukprot:6177868-Pleurochrysis_carterae.AAC.1
MGLHAPNIRFVLSRGSEERRPRSRRANQVIQKQGKAQENMLEEAATASSAPANANADHAVGSTSSCKMSTMYHVLAEGEWAS